MVVGIGSSGGGTARRAMTLTELVVAVGVLVLLMSMIATIFVSASKASGKAKAITDIHRQVRQVAETIRKDLENVDPAKHILAIAGVEVSAYNTPDDAQLNRPKTIHRSDVVGFLTGRSASPYVFQQPSDPADAGRIELDTSVSQVVYGHADLARLVETTPGSGVWQWDAASVQPVETGQTPSSLWHLARRILLFPNSPLSPAQLARPGVGPRNAPYILTNQEVLLSQSDVFVQSLDEYDATIGLPLPGVYRFTGSEPQDFYYVSINGEWMRWENNRWLHFAGGKWHYYEGVRNNPCPSPPPARPQDQPDCCGGTHQWTYEDQQFGLQHQCTLFYPPGASVFSNYLAFFYPAAAAVRRTRIDPSPPAQELRPLAHYFMQGCSEFRVQFTYDDPRELPRLPGNSGTGEPVEPEPPEPVRWWSVPPGQVIIWSRVSPNATADGLSERYRWPRALKITLRVYDPSGRLEEPLEHSIIHRWQ